MRTLLAIALLLASTTAFADIQVQGRVFSDSECRYFSTNTGEFIITYTIPEDLDVTFRYGWDPGYNRGLPPDAWVQGGAIRMEKRQAWKGFEYRVAIRDQVDVRGEFHRSKLRFVFERFDFNGNCSYDKGSNGALGYYETDFGTQLTPACDLNVPFQALQTGVVRY